MLRAEPLHLLYGGDRVAEGVHDLRRELEAQVHPLGADVEQQVTRRCDRVARSGPKLAERVKLRRTRLAEQAIRDYPTSVPARLTLVRALLIRPDDPGFVLERVVSVIREAAGVRA